MDYEMLAAFTNELNKIAGANVMTPSSISQGSNIMAPSAFQKPGLAKPTSNPAAKPTNYSIVNTQAPTAAETTAPASMKAVPPPPVRT